MLFTFLGSSALLAQSISINNTGNPPNESAMLDVQSATKGVLVPRINLDNVDNSMLDGSTQAALGLLIFNSNASVIGGSGIGFYTFNGSTWEKLITSSSGVAVDVDFYEEGTTSPPNDINDDLFTYGHLGIGKPIVDYPLDIESDERRGINTLMNGSTDDEIVGLYTENANNGSGRHIGSYNSMIGTGSGVQYGSFQLMANSADGIHYGSFNNLTGSGNGPQYGTSQNISNIGTGIHYGSHNSLSGNGSGEQYGSYQWLSNNGDGDHFGNYNVLSGIGEGRQIGTTNAISNTGDASHLGTLNNLSGSGTGSQVGTWQAITNNGSGDHYGSLNSLQGTGEGVQYGTYNGISNAGDGYKYGSYNTVSGNGSGQKFGSYQEVIATGGSHHYGSFNSIDGSHGANSIGSEQHISGSGDGLHYGIINRLAGDGDGNQFGIFNWMTNSGSGNKYGTFNLIPSTSPGTHYGVYSSVTKAESFAGYFFGNVYVGSDIVSGPRPNMQISGGSDATYLDGSGDLAIGELDEANIVIDVNEILARNNGSSSPLFIQKDGGDLLLAADELGAVGIGVGSSANMPNGFLLAVDGGIIAEDLVLEISGSWPDYVFQKSYELKRLDRLEEEIESLGHLPGMPSAEEVQEDGISVGAMQKKLLEKIEELTLYMIAANKQIEILKAEITELQKE